MGVRGARSLMDADQARYCTKFTWNVASNGDNTNEDDKLNLDCNEHNTLGLLIDAKSFLYHVVVGPKDIMYASPATIGEQCMLHVHRLLRVVGRDGGVHIFFDGLPPEEKIPQQIQRMGAQTLSGDRLAKGTVFPTTKFLHHLAECAFIEAIEKLRPRFSNSLHMHRPVVGEGEAMINLWLIQNHGRYSKTLIISEDSDFLVYDSCDGFVPPSSLVYKEVNGRYTLEGCHYLKSKFLGLLLGQEPCEGARAMTTIAALAGCDYTLSRQHEQIIDSMKHKIVNSDLGGLRPKNRSNPSASSVLLAILRCVAHFKRSKGTWWLQSFCLHFAGEQKASLAKGALQRVHDIYMYTLQVVERSTIDLLPGSVEVQRLVQHGYVYCYPVVEAAIRPEHSQNHSNFASQHAMVICPPSTTQIEAWMSRSSAWNFPHFQQIRRRLYNYVHLMLRSGKRIAAMRPRDEWTSRQRISIYEVVQVRTGEMKEEKISLSDPVLIPSKVEERQIFHTDSCTIDRALAYCLFGIPGEYTSLKSVQEKASGQIMIAAAMLPFNLACLLFMMSTAPPNFAEEDWPIPAFDRACCFEVTKILPILSVACAQANLLVNTIIAFWPDRFYGSKFTMPPVNVGRTFRHDSALLIWEAMRLVQNLEYVCPDAKEISGYLDAVFANLQRMMPSNEEASFLVHWMKEVESKFSAWWELFGTNNRLPGADESQ